MSLSLSVDGPGDAELISAVRGGDVDSYGELFARHVDAARRLARQLAGPADADDLVSDAFTKVLTVLQRGGGPDLAFRAYLLTAVRRLHVDKIRAGSRLRPVDDLTPFDPGLPFQDTAVEGFDNAAAARAFASLPERWQMVLWHTEVEQQKPADIAPLLGMSANSVSALAYRAREGLRQAFLSQHATDPDDVDCGWTRDHLGAYVRGGLSRRDAKRVDDHLEECRACAAVYLELTEVNSGLAGLIAPLLLGAAGAKYATSIGGGAAAGGAGTSGGFAAAQAWAAAHVGLTAIGGLAVTATALIAVYGATHLKSHDAADVGSGALSPVPSATSGQSPDGVGPGGTSSRGATTNGTTSPGASTSTTGTDAASPSADASATTSTDAPASDATSGVTDSTTPPPTDTTTGPTDPGTGTVDPGADDITFTSIPPIDPVFGSTYQVQASSASGKNITFTVDGTPANACTITGDTVSFDHAGTCVITATVTARTAARAAGAGAGSGLAASKVFSQTVVIPKGKQTIGFQLGDGAQVDDGLPLNADGGASHKAVTFTSDTPAVCTVNDNGTRVAFHHARECTVTAHQDGSEDYKPADDVSRTVNVQRGVQTIDFTSTAPDDAVVQGTSYDVRASGGRSGNPVKFSVDADASPACTVEGDTVSFAHAGTCVVSAHQNGDDDYQPADRTQHVEVGKGTQTLDFTTVPDGKVGTSARLHATSSAGLDVTFSTDSTSCTVTGDSVTYDHARACVVTASAGNADWKNATQDQIVLVARGDQTVAFPDVTGARVGTDSTLHATSSAGLDVTFSTDSTSCSVSGDTVTFEHARPCVVTASAGNTDWNDASHAQTIDIARGNQTVDFTPVTDGKVGTSSPLRATSSTGLDVTFSTDDASCTVLGSTVTFAHASPCVVTATQAGDDDWNKATADQTIGIAKGDQTITFDPPTDAAVGGTDTLRATTSAGLDVTFSSSSDSCTVSGSGITYDHARPCTVTASSDGNDDYNAATSLDRTFDIAKGKPHLTVTVPNKPLVGGTGTVSATSESDGAITFSLGDNTSNEACTVSPDGTVTFRHAGTCVVVATQSESADYLKASATSSFGVGKGTPHLTVTVPDKATVGGKGTVSATSESDGAITFSLGDNTSNEACTVTPDGTLAFRHAGTCDVVATQAETADFAATSADAGFAVAKGTPRLTVTVPGKATVGGTGSVTATSESDGAITFSLADTTTNAACTVSPDGTVTFRHAGTCAVTATQAESADYGAATATADFAVGKGEQHLTFQLPATAKLGDTLPLTATGGASGNPVTFTTTAACVLNDAGTAVTLKHAGSCMVTAHQAGNDDYTAAADVAQTVAVGKGEQHITFQLPGTGKVGDSLALNATGGPSGNPVTFTGNAACVVNAAGTAVRLAHAGTCTVTAHQAGNDDYTAADDVAQTVAVAKGDQKIIFTLPATGKVGDTLALTATGGASGNPVTFTSSAACTVDGTTLTLAHAGTCTVTAHQAGNDDYTAADDVAQTVAVAKGDQKITFTLPATGKVGDTLALTATGGASGNPVTYTVAPDSQKVCSISGSNLRLDHPGACRVAAHQKGNDDYNEAPEATQTVTVAKGEQKITFTSTPPSPAVVGSTYGVTATGGASGKAVAFGSSTTAVCSVSGSTVTFLKAGTCTVTADQPGNDDYLAAPQATQTFTVSAPARDLTMNITTRPGLLFGIFGTIVDVQVVGLDPGAHATLEMKAHHAIALSPATCDDNGSDNHADCDVTSTPTTFSFLAIVLQHDADLQFEVTSKDSNDSNPNNNEQTVPLN